MKKIFILLLIVPFFSFSQTKAKTQASVESGFVITGNVTGYPDGTSVSFLNDQTGQPEKQTAIELSLIHI